MVMLAALRTAQYFKERAARADMEAFWAILEQAGTEAPREGDWEIKRLRR
jgi:hypothetical protein